jgi:hypothetical protein
MDLDFIDVAGFFFISFIVIGICDIGYAANMPLSRLILLAVLFTVGRILLHCLMKALSKFKA